ncbi:Eco57I restriction-modification methylase domain-containing protein [Nostoc sp. FACHB-888]|uniref:Eco57I restriction-modification methylase domain-containing protein n=1 Tax=Nostoc sp. FACHB-888 TaxID=2692842 RepID=UPI0016888807|nr:Eco57I restriction-modification methylase domain-containing protein [Nostoc sp. FACHB-888]MBD2247049.1 Eco57I restriction-modification methylase domain-containing protein [Nostoc sp. FACHB-888]
MRTFINSSWIESSEVEVQLAKLVAQYLCVQSKTDKEICLILEGLALFLSNEGQKNPWLISTLDELNKLFFHFAQIKKIDLKQQFPSSKTDLTCNFFSRLFNEVELISGKKQDQGIVATPPILAIDMVRLAAASWLLENSNITEADIIKVIWHITPIPLDSIQKVRKLLQKVIWYDPCIGGGIFPLAILLLFAQLNIPINTQLLRNIKGTELSCVAVTASCIRLAFAISNLSGDSYESVRASLSSCFYIGNALNFFTEQITFQLEPNDQNNQLVDIVVGNPPYVRANRIDRNTKNYLRKLYPSIYSGSVDLYNYFIAHGILALKPQGTLCFVSPASFQKSKYGNAIRNFISKCATLKYLFDFDELQIFEDVNIHTSVYVLNKNSQQGDYRTYAFRNLPEISPLFYGLQNAGLMPCENASVEGWSINYAETESLLKIICKNTTPLIYYAGKILSGIKTGCKKAYFLSQTEAQQFLLDQNSAQFLKPMLRPVGIKTWQAKWDGTYLILVRKGEIVPQNSKVMEHLLIYEKLLRNRTDTRGHPTWYGLRECEYYHLFNKAKIIFPDISSECRFAIDLNGYLIPDGAFFIPSSDYFLLGLLNSCIARFYFRNRCNSIGNPHNGGRLRFKKTYIEEFPIPKPLENNIHLCQEIEHLSQLLTTNPAHSGIIERIDYLSLKLYRIPEKYWTILSRN